MGLCFNRAYLLTINDFMLCNSMNLQKVQEFRVIMDVHGVKLGDSCMNNFSGKVNSHIADLEQCANHQSHWTSTEYTVKQIEIPK